MAEETSNPNAITAAVQNGKVAMISPDGDAVWMERDSVQAALGAGYMPETSQAMRDREATEQVAEEFNSPGLAALAGMGRGLTLGFSDLAMTQTGLVEEDTLAKLQEHNPAASEGANLIGLLGSSLIPGGPLARLGSLGGKLASGSRGVAGLAGGGRIAGAIGGAAAEGAGIGMSDAISGAALSEEPVTVDRAIEAIKNAGTGAAINAGLSLAGAGLGSLVRFASKSQQKLFNKMQNAQSNQLSGWKRRLEAQSNRVKLRDQLDDEIVKAGSIDDAVNAMGAIDGSGGRTVIDTPKGLAAKGRSVEQLRKRKARVEAKIYKAKLKGDVSDKLDELQAQLERATKQLDDRKRNLVSSMSSRAGERYLAHSVGGALGGMLGSAFGPVGGIGGFALGGAAGAAVANRVRAYVRPLIHDVVKSPKFKSTASKVGYGVSKTVSGTAAAAKTLTVKEFTKLRDELNETPDPVGLVQMVAESMPPDIPAPIRQKVSHQQARALGVIKEYMPPSRHDTSDIPSGSARQDPGIIARRKLTKVSEAVMNPERAIDNFALGRLSIEEAVALDRVYGEELEPFRRAVLEAVEYARSQGTGFSRHKVQQIRRFLGEGLPSPGAGSRVPAVSTIEEPRGPGRPPSQKAPQVAGAYQTTFGEVGGRIGRKRS